MDAITLTTSLISGLNGARQFVASALQSRDHAVLQQALLEVSGKLLAAGSDALTIQMDQIKFAQMYAAIQQRTHELEAEIAELRRANADFEKYELFELSEGVFVYSKRPDTKRTEPAHYLCTRCRNEGKKSVLNRVESSTSVVHRCPTCDVTYLEKKIRSSPLSAQYRDFP